MNCMRLTSENQFYNNKNNCECNSKKQFNRNVKLDGVLSPLHVNSRSLYTNFISIFETICHVSDTFMINITSVILIKKCVNLLQSYTKLRTSDLTVCSISLIHSLIHYIMCWSTGKQLQNQHTFNRNSQKWAVTVTNKAWQMSQHFSRTRGKVLKEVKTIINRVRELQLLKGRVRLLGCQRRENVMTSVTRLVL